MYLVVYGLNLIGGELEADFELARVECKKTRFAMASDAQEIDYAFECDAPTFVDFDKLRQGEWDEEDIDSWFGARVH